MLGISLYDAVINLSYLLFLVGFALKNILWLRVVIIIAASVDIVGRAWLAPEPLHTDIIWCVFDIVVNGYQLVMILIERSALKFTDEEKHLHKTLFRNIPELQYRRLLDAGRWHTLQDETTIVEQNSEMDSLIVIYDGLVKIEVDGKIVSYLRNASFVGEMSFITGDLTTASVKTLMPTHVISWEKSVMKELMDKDHELQMAMNSVFSGDLIAKLKKHTKGISLIQE